MTAPKLLASFERPYMATIQPIVRWLVSTGIRPNTITTIGTLFVVISAAAYAVGQMRIGGFLLLLSGVTDTLDGQVARQTSRASKFGAFYDSTLDRVGDGATFIGIGWFLMTTPSEVAFRDWAVLLCMLGVLASLLVSYARARAEGLGLDCKVGIAQRAERLLGLGLLTLVVGAGPQALVLESVVLVLTLLSAITVVQRFVYVYQVTGAAGD